MGKAIAALLILLALTAQALFLSSGAGSPGQGQLAGALGPMAGSPLLAAGGGLLLAMGLGLLGRAGGPEAPYALREVLLLASVAIAAAFSVALALGVARGWSPATLAALLLGAGTECLAGVGIAIRIAAAEQRRKGLFVAGLLGLLPVTLFVVAVLVLGGSG